MTPHQKVADMSSPTAQGNPSANRGVAAPSWSPEALLICGHGRSGTNWLLSLLDYSPRTHCRNGPYALAGNPLGALPARSVARDDAPLQGADWDAAMRWTAARMGAGDQRIAVHKHHLHRWSHPLGLTSVLYRNRLRRLLGLAWPPLRKPEWRMPFWLGSARRLAEALPVVRMSQAPGWGCWVLAHRPATAVLHIVRHPAGFLDSWRRRYVAARDADAVLAANRERLHEVRDVDPTWGRRFGDIDALSLEASELWYWRYSTEVMHKAGESAPGYKLVVYESLAEDVAKVAQDVYRHCGLDWSPGVERRIAATGRESAGIAAGWKNRLASEQVDLIERITADSPMMKVWS